MPLRKLQTFLLIIINAICVTNSFRILIVFPMPAPSHYFLGNALARGLVQAGHDVTMVSAFGEKNPPKNGTYRDIILTGFKEKRQEQEPAFFQMGEMNVVMNIILMNMVGNEVTAETLQHPNFQKLINSAETFDIIILEQFKDDALKALAYHFKAPLILFSTMGANAWVNPLFGNPSPSSYVPDIFLSYTSDMSFCQRLVNSFVMLLHELNRQFIFIPKQNKLMKQYFPDSPDLDILEYNSSLILLNSHESTSQAVPHVPNMIDIGGFHINPPKELPEGLKYLMDNAKEGVVYFSMGSNIKPSQMNQHMRQSITNALGKLKQKVLWKWDDDTLPGLPKNVILSKWFPQQDILAHHNTKLFITHGGLLSLIETIYHGVPILAFPVFGDQKLNAARAQLGGYGLSLPLTDITEDRMTEALNELLLNPKYKQNAKKRSALMHDRPMKPLDLAIYWTEFVARHGGAPHLRVAGVDLPWYKYFLLDVFAFISIMIISSIFIFYLVIKRICFSFKRQPKLKNN